MNPHFGMTREDYLDLDDDEFMLLVEEFKEYNRQTRNEMRKSQQGARR